MAYFQSSDPSLTKQVWKNALSGDEILRNIEKGIFPTCPNSEIPARPNVYMFRDDSYINSRSKEQERRFQEFLNRNKGRNVLIFEIGSGPHIQTVRIKTRMLKTEYGANIIRINPKDFRIKSPHIGIDKGALVALKEIYNYLKGR